MTTRVLTGGSCRARVRGEGHGAGDRGQSFEEGQRGQKPKNAGTANSQESRGSVFFPGALRRHGPCWHPGVNPVRLISDF